MIDPGDLLGQLHDPVALVSLTFLESTLIDARIDLDAGRFFDGSSSRPPWAGRRGRLGVDGDDTGDHQGVEAGDHLLLGHGREVLEGREILGGIEARQDEPLARGELELAEHALEAQLEAHLLVEGPEEVPHGDLIPALPGRDQDDLRGRDVGQGVRLRIALAAHEAEPGAISEAARRMISRVSSWSSFSSSDWVMQPRFTRMCPRVPISSAPWASRVRARSSSVIH